MKRQALDCNLSSNSNSAEHEILYLPYYQNSQSWANIYLCFFFYCLFRPPSKDISGVIDQTRGLLDYVEKNCSRAVYTTRMKYVCIAGRYIQELPSLATLIYL